MRVPIEGLIHVTGEPDSGKSTFCLTVPGVKPEEIFFIDDDLKTCPLADELDKQGQPFGLFVDLMGESTRRQMTKPLALWKLVDEYVTQAEKLAAKNKFKVAVFDNISRFEEAIRAYSETVLGEYTDKSAGTLRIGQFTWSYTFIVYTQFLERLMKIADLVLITTHIREQYFGQVKTGKMEARGQRPLLEKSNLRLWLRHNPDSPAPIGLVLKRIMRMHITTSGMEAVNVLPRRLVPCTWDKIVEYLNNPVGNRPPTTAETPNSFELSVLDGELTPDQKDALRLARVAAEQSEFPVPTPDPDPIRFRARELKGQGLPPPTIAATLAGEFSRDFTIPEVLGMLT